MMVDNAPIAAIATAPGQGGIGIVRVSGRDLSALISAVCRKPLAARHATLSVFHDEDGNAIDEGIAIRFAAPHSYTGEEVLELQAHGGPVVLQMILGSCLAAGRSMGLRLAEPGEFTRRAFLNDRLDLAQAEAVADLIEASTREAVRSARASLSGSFSRAIDGLSQRILELRALVEATLDFPEEELEFLKASDALGRLARITSELNAVLARAQQGAILRQGLNVVLAGRPNVGKSSLLNALAQAEVAIVTPIAGTTRDTIRQTIQVEGVALHMVDTAGLRDSSDEVERIGIERTWEALGEADVVLHLRDVREPTHDEDRAISDRLPTTVPVLEIYNKVDLAVAPPPASERSLGISAKTGEGIDKLREKLLEIAGWHRTGESVFLARERHLLALQDAGEHLGLAREHGDQGDSSLDLFAEELRLAHEALGRITGHVHSDDVLGEIFGRFCIGK